MAQLSRVGALIDGVAQVNREFVARSGYLSVAVVLVLCGSVCIVVR